jgi:hypothetical protein
MGRALRYLALGPQRGHHTNTNSNLRPHLTQTWWMTGCGAPAYSRLSTARRQIVLTEPLVVEKRIDSIQGGPELHPAETERLHEAP